jgi:hypothetical protein
LKSYVGAKMKSRLFVATLLAILLSIAGLNIARAQWSAIKNSGYAVTTDWHGEDVPIGESVTAWAGTTDSEVYKVEFKWKDPDENVIFDENVMVLTPYTTPDVPPNVPQEIAEWADNNHGFTIYHASNAQTPYEIGDWGVQILFYAPEGHLQGEGSEIIKIRATSINVIPEIPVVGTAGAAIAMLLGIGLFWKKKEK